MEKKRLISLKTRIGPIISGKYVVKEGFEPNYVIAQNGMKLSRVRLMGTVVDKFAASTGKLVSITLDDSTATIRAKMFNSPNFFDGIDEGDVIDVIGRVKEYQDEIFIIPETVRKVDDVNWELLREMEIRESLKIVEKKRKLVKEFMSQTSDLMELKKLMSEKYEISEDEVEALIPQESEAEAETNNKEKILQIISEADKGDGCEYALIMEKSGLSESELDIAVSELIDEGSIFEPRPGRIKKI